MKREKKSKKKANKSQARTIPVVAKMNKNRQVTKMRIMRGRRKKRKTEVTKKKLMRWYTKDLN